MITVPSFASEVADLLDVGPLPRKDLSGHNCRPIGVLKPRNRAEVARIVKAAARHRAKLHAVSCGRNWGFGSSLPRKSSTWIVDLSRLDRISDYDRETGTISVEPGVTQIDLHRELRQLGAEWFFNVTGAGHSTSLLGNALERGIGYYGQRQLDLVELEVITGRGELITTRLPGSGATLGLDVTQLFVQSALGIVVSARLRLLPKCNGGGAVILRLRNESRFTEFLQQVLRLKRECAVVGVPHIANRERIYTTLAPWTPAEHRSLLAERTSSWTAAIPVTGCREMTEAFFGLVQRRFSEYCEVETIISPSVTNLDAASPLDQLHLLISGYPSNLALAGVEWTALGTANPAQRDPEATRAGLIHITPAAKSSAEDILRVVSAVEQNASRLGLPTLPMTVNAVDQCTTVVIVSIGFAASAAKSAKLKARKLEQKLRDLGILPYRIGLGQEDWMPTPSDEARLVHRKIRAAFDPSRTFATSKYDIASRNSRLGVKHLRNVRVTAEQKEAA